MLRPYNRSIWKIYLSCLASCCFAGSARELVEKNILYPTD